jgi:hypothetical protein
VLASRLAPGGTPRMMRNGLSWGLSWAEAFGIAVSAATAPKAARRVGLFKVIPQALRKT